MVWGRGALDMKDDVAEQLMVLLLLKRQGVALKRDVIYAATADEEIGGPDGFGVSWLIKHHPDLLRGNCSRRNQAATLHRSLRGRDHTDTLCRPVC